MRPLSMVPPGVEVEVAEIRGGWRSTKKIKDMGILPGIRLKIMVNYGRGPIIVEFNNKSRLAIGKGLAQKIIVK